MDHYRVLYDFVARKPIDIYHDGINISNDADILGYFLNNDWRLNAIRHASYDVYKRLIRHSLSNQDLEPRLRYTLLKYIIRLSSRATPFGLLASVNMGTWAPKTKLPRVHGFKTSINLDHAVKKLILDWLIQDSNLVNTLVLSPNTSLYEFGTNEYRYIQSRLENDKRINELVSVKRSELLNHVVNVSKFGILGQELKEVIHSQIQDEVKASTYLSNLVKNQIIVTELDLTITGEDWLSLVRNKLSNECSFGSQKRLSFLGELSEIIQNTNPWNLSDSLALLAKIINDNGLYINSDNLISINTYSIGQDQLDVNLGRRLLKCINALGYISSPMRNANMDRFREQFVRKFENRLIPLAQVIDNEIGIGYGNKKFGNGDPNFLLSGIEISELREMSFEWNLIREFLFQKISIFTIEQKAIHISSSELEIVGKKPSKDSLCSTMSMTFSGTISDEGNLENVVLEGAFGPSATKLIGRFGNDNNEILSLLKTIAEFEIEGGQNETYAEIVHDSEYRHGNIGLRPKLYGYEIPYLCSSTNDSSKIIRIDELSVTVRGEYVVLLHPKLGIIKPCLSNSHNTNADTLPLYQFLCDLSSYNEVINIGFDWGFPLNQLFFLPRVYLDGIVVSKATYNLSKHHMDRIMSFKSNMDKLNEYLESLKLPRVFSVHEGDNYLNINRLNSAHLNLFYNYSRNKDRLTLKETFVDDDCKSVIDKIVEFVVPISPISNTNSEIFPEIFSSHHENIDLDRCYFPGTNWLYFKIYCGPSVQDTILRFALIQIIHHLKEQQHINSWFFIRYGDPEDHLRIRFNLKSVESISYIIKLVNNSLDSLCKSELISLIQLDTYKREIERYGKSRISLSETLFWLDSECVLEFYSTINERDKNDYTWKFGLISTDTILNDFNLNVELRVSLLTSIIKGYYDEFTHKKNFKLFKMSIDKKCRFLREEVTSMIGKNRFNDSRFNQWQSGFERRSKQVLRSIQSQVYLNSQSFVYSDEGFLFYSSIMHMNLNRVFHANQRLSELIILELLLKEYTRQIKTNAK